MKKRVSSLLLVLALILCAMTQPALAAPKGKSELAFKEAALELYVGEKYLLEVQIPDSLADEKLAFSGGSSRVASVNSKGEITAKGAGSVTIIVKAGDATASSNVTVYAKATKLTLPANAVVVKPGKTLQLAPTLSPKGAKQEFTYATSNKKIATVSGSGLIKGVKEGEAVITVTGPNDVKATCTVTVSKTAGEAPAAGGVAATRVLLDQRELTMERGDTYQLKVTMKPSNASPAVTFTSSNEKVATVDQNGKVTAVGDGYAEITVETPNNLKFTCAVLVRYPSAYFKQGKQAAEMAALIQKARADANASAFQETASMNKAADVRAQELVQSFAHKRPNNKNGFTVLKEYNISYSVAYEVMARGYSTAKELMQELLQDSDSVKAIKNRSYKYMAVGHAKSGGTDYWIILFAG